MSKALGARPFCANDDPADSTDADHTPLLINPVIFKAACLDIKPEYAGINFEHYRLEILHDSRAEGLVLPAYRWRKRIRRWLDNASSSKQGLVMQGQTAQKPASGIVRASTPIRPSTSQPVL